MVENALQGIDSVRATADPGVPDELLGLAVPAYVVLEETSALTGKIRKRSLVGD